MKMTVITAAVLLMLGVGTAKGEESYEFTGENIDQHVGLPNEHHHHEFRIPRDDDPILGVGLDAIVYESENELFGAATEYRYDATNGGHSVYAVGKVNLWKMWKELMPFTPDLFVYLKPDIEVAMERLHKRNREGETVSVEYQKALQEKHADFLGKDMVNISESRYVPCFHLFTNANFLTHDPSKLSITERILDRLPKKRI